jgi:glycosyltransferase involved in cell wall biosynthesis
VTHLDVNDHDGGLTGVGGELAGAGTPRRVVISALYRDRGSTGVHTHVRQLRRYLEESGTTTTWVSSFSWGRMLQIPVFGFRFVLMPWRGAEIMWWRHWHEVFLRHALRRELSGAGDCVVYAQGPLEARAAIRARRDPRQRVVMAVHFRVSQADEYAEPGREEIRRDGAQYRAIRRAERGVIPAVDGLVYVSRWAQDALVAWLPEAASVRSEVISNFVAPTDFEAGGEVLADLVTTGTLEPRKNHRFVLEMMAAANRAGRRLTLDIFGDGPLRTDLERMTHALGLDDQVRFRGDRADVRDFLPRYRAYVHASQSESSSLAIIEAMAAALPIVAGNIGPIAELCTDGAEGRFWPLDDPARAAATVIELLGNEPERLKAASAASQRFHLEFSADVVAPRLRSFLLEPGPLVELEALAP